MDEKLSLRWQLFLLFLYLLNRKLAFHRCKDTIRAMIG